MLDGRRDAVYAGEEGRPIRWRALFSEPIWLDGVSAWQGAVGQLRVFAGGDSSRTLGSAGTGLGASSTLMETADADATMGEVPAGSAPTWQKAQLAAPVLTDVVELEWIPGGPTAPPEIAFWARGSSVDLALKGEGGDGSGDLGFVGASSVGTSGGAADYAAQLHLGHLAGGTTYAAFPSDARVSVAAVQTELAAKVRVHVPSLKGVGRAFLVYELAGAPHFVAVGRSLNGIGLLGGQKRSGWGPGGMQVEEVPVAALRDNENTIEFYPADPHVTGEYRVRDVRIVTLPEGAIEHVISSGHDGHIGRLDARLDWDVPVSLGEVAFFVSAKSKGKLLFEGESAQADAQSGPKRGLKAERGSKKSPAMRLELDLSSLPPGWHRADVSTVLGTTRGLGVRLSKDAEPGSVAKVVVSGLKTPGGSSGGLVVSYPARGECFEGRATVRGFAYGLDRPHIWVGDRKVDVLRDGSFEYSAEGRTDAPWHLTLRALGTGRGDTRPIERRLAMQPCLDEVAVDRSQGPIADVGAPHSVVLGAVGGTVEFGGAKLEVPAGALDRPTRLSIRPLKASDVPEMSPGAVNVTPGKMAYRFGPHGLKFNVPVKLSLPYDEKALPPAGRKRDVTGLYYDEVTARWEPVGRFGEPEGGRMVSLTDHFTDFINATIATPDGPGMESFTPTRMKDMELGNPLSGVSMMSPPTASPSGAAVLQYPLELPPGRNGMQPNLALTYSSQGGPSWVGQGWDLSLSKIELDTRYGVPDYDNVIGGGGPHPPFGDNSSRAGKLTYLLDGEQLTEVESAGGVTKFRRRVEGSFQRILRVPSPDGHVHFEVTGQDGTRFIYGRSASARLDDPGNGAHIFRWALEEVRDVFGNGIVYSYSKESAPVGTSDNVSSVGLYPTRIEYTDFKGAGGTGSNEAAGYAIEFHRQSDGNGNLLVRPDSSLDGRAGFLTSDRYLLERVQVVYLAGAGHETIRSYQFEYTTGAFGKPLLQYVRHHGRDGTEFYHHELSYRNQANEPFSNFFAWNADPLSGTFAGQARTSSTGSGWSATVSGGFGFSFLNFSVAGGGGFTDTSVQGLFRDVTGDGVADFLSTHSTYSVGQLQYGVWGDTTRPDKSPGYGAEVFEPSFQDGALGKNRSTEWHTSASASAFGLAGLSGHLGRSWEEEKATLADMNGDGFVDMVRLEEGTNRILVRLGRGGSFFGQETSWGTMQKNIVQKPRSVPSGADAREGAAGPGDEEWSADLAAGSYPVDPVLAWIAPFDGDIVISGAATREVADGDPIALFIHRQGAPDLWQSTIPSGDTSAHVPPATPLHVLAGQAIYFRVSAGGQARNASVLWSPHIEYVGSSASSFNEPYGLPSTTFDLASDLRTSGSARRAFLATSPGDVRIETTLTKQKTPDELRLRVYILDASNPSSPVRTPIDLDPGDPSKDYWLVPADAVSSPVSLNHPAVVSLGAHQTLEFVAETDAPVDPKDVTWSATVEYLTYFRPNPADPSAPPTPTPVHCYLSPYPAEAAAGMQRCSVTNDPFPDRPLPYAIIRGPSDTNLSVPVFKTERADEFLIASGGTVQIAPSGAASGLICQADRTLIGKGGGVLTADVEPGAHISCLNVNGPDLIVSVSGASGGTLVARGVEEDPVFRDFADALDLTNYGLSWVQYRQSRSSLGGGYHRWFYGDWNGLEPFDPSALIAENIVQPPSPGQPPLVGMPGSSDIQGVSSWNFRGGASIRAGVFTPALASAPGSAGSIQALRSSHTWNYGLEASLVGVGFGLANADTTSDQDFVDVNGDGLADIVTAAGVQYNRGCRNAATQTELGALDPTSEPATCQGSFGPLTTAFDQELSRTETRVLKGSFDPLGAVSGILGAPDFVKHTEVKPASGSGKKGIRAIYNGGFSVGVNYGQTSSHRTQADVNGDGLVDYVSWSPGETSPRVRLNLGYSLAPEVPWELDLTRFGTYEDGEAGQAALFSGGGLGQYFAGIGSQLGHLNAVSLGSPSFGDTTSMSIGGTVGGSVGVVGAAVGGGAVVSVKRDVSALLDVTGDGAADYVQRLPNTEVLLVRPNLGERFGPTEAWPMPIFASEPGGDDVGGLVANVLADTIFGSTGGGDDGRASLDVLSFDRSDDLQFTASIQFCFLVCIGVSSTYSESRSFGEMAPDDINGDGFTDFVLKQAGSGKVYTRLNQQSGANLLERVNGPAGKVITIEYGRDGNTVENPRNQFILAATTVSVPDPFGGPTQSYRSTFDYGRTGKYDRDERESFGYAQVVTTRPDGSTIATTFHNSDFYRKGLPVSTSLRNQQGNRYTETTYLYQEPASNLAPLSGSTHPAELERTISQYEGHSTAGLTTRELRTWSPVHGNLLTWAKLGELSDPADDLIYSISYQAFNTSSSDPSELYAVRASEIVATSSTNTILRKRTATFDARAAVTSVSDHVWGGTDALGSAYNGALSTRTISARDSYGNVTRITDPTGYHLAYSYDESIHTHVIATTDSFGYLATNLPNYYFGGVDEVRDVNRNISQYTYDTFGRLTAVIGPRDIGMAPTITYAYPTTLMSSAGVLGAVTGHKDISRNHPASSSQDYIETAIFVDALGRTVQTKKDHLQDTGTTLQVGTVVSGRVTFDSLGRVIRVGQPRFSATGAGAFVTNLPELNPTLTTYDVLDRVTEVRTPIDPNPTNWLPAENPAQPPPQPLAEAVMTTTYGIAPEPGSSTNRLRTVVLDALSKSKEIYRDQDGSIRAVVEHNPSAGHPDLTTRYQYDPLDQLLSVTDARGNVVSSVYDTLGRMISLSSPDTGLTKWSYDLAGNLKAKETARLRAQSKKVRYVHEYNRLVQVDYPDSPDRFYHYGMPHEFGLAHGNVAGRVKFEQSEAGTRHLGYDELGNTVRIAMEFGRMREPHCGPYIAEVSYEYDSFGRILKTRFPLVENETDCGQYTLNATNEAITYAYDQGGNLQSVFGQNQVVNPQHPNEAPHSDYLLHIGYNEFGQKVRQLSGNFVRTTFSYQPRSRRLASIFTDRNGAKPMQRLEYAYDAVGNVIGINNNIPYVAQPGTARVGGSRQLFAYDDLYQLKSASGWMRNEQNNRHRYFVGMEYDQLGNIALKDQVSYRQVLQNGNWNDEYHVHGQMYKAKYFYDGPRPHTPNLIVEAIPNENVNIGYGEYDFRRDFTYDQNGNQTQSVYRGNDTRQLTWNEDDQLTRVVKNNQELNKTRYDAQGNRAVHVHQVTGMEETSYLTANMTLRDGKFVTKHVFAGSERLSSKMDPDWFSSPPILYFHTDHLGSTHYTTNNTQTLIQHEEYFPSGELWKHESDSLYELAQRFTFSG
ncbi:MAG: hypothetical protein B6A08_13900, partial [Sorangiineae bacterium NIC37A_2]